MDIRQLKQFLAVCEYGSILNASQHLYISQQALSKTISTLENELGSKLFIRTAKGIALTGIGELLQQNSAPIVEQFDEMLSLMNDRIKGKRDNVSIGICNGLWVVFSPFIRTQLSNIFTESNIEIVEYPFNILEEMTAKGFVSFSIVNGPCTNQNLVVEKIVQIRRFALVSKDCALSQKSELHLEDLADYSLALNINSRCREMFYQTCKKRGLSLDVVNVSDTMGMLYLINGEHRVGIYPAHLLDTIPTIGSEIVAVPFAKEEMPYELDLIIDPTLQNNSSIIEAANYLKGIIKSVCSPLA